jgi:hypothetical protein
MGMEVERNRRNLAAGIRAENRRNLGAQTCAENRKKCVTL